MKAIKTRHRSFLAALMAASAAFCATVRAQDSDADLAKQLSNPVAALISVPLQSNFGFRMGPLSEGWKYTLNFQIRYLTHFHELH